MFIGHRLYRQIDHRWNGLHIQQQLTAQEIERLTIRTRNTNQQIDELVATLWRIHNSTIERVSELEIQLTELTLLYEEQDLPEAERTFTNEE